MMTKWDKHHFGTAVHISEMSKDPSRKVGCVIVDENNIIRSTGYNGFVRGVPDDPDMQLLS